MLITLAGAMSTAELGISLAELIRQDKVHAISCTGANLEEDIFNLVAHTHYERVPHYRYLTAEDEVKLLKKGMNRVTDTCIPEDTAIRRIEKEVLQLWQKADQEKKRYYPYEYMYQLLEALLTASVKSIRKTAGCLQQKRKIFRFSPLAGKILLWATSLSPMSLRAISVLIKSLNQEQSKWRCWSIGTKVSAKIPELDFSKSAEALPATYHLRCSPDPPRFAGKGASLGLFLPDQRQHDFVWIIQRGSSQ